MRERVLVVVCSSTSILTPSAEGLISDKLDPYIQEAINQGWVVLVVLRGATEKLQGKSPYRVSKFPGISFQKLSLGLIRSVFDSARSMSRLTLETLRLTWRESRGSWEDVFEKLNPDMVIGTGLYEEIIEACQLRSIKAIEVQHGLFSKSNLDTYWPRIFPDIFFTWDMLSAEIAHSKGMYAIVTGHPMAEENWILNRSIELSNKSNQSSVKRLSFALSWGETGAADPFFTMTQDLRLKVDQVVELGFTPVFRIHPAFTDRKLRALLLSIWLKLNWPSSVIEAPRKRGLRETISDCTALISHSSSTTLEFGFAGKKTLVLDERMRSYYRRVFSSLGLSVKLVVDSIEELTANSIDKFHSDAPKFIGSAVFGNLLRKVKG